jgi:transposase
MIGSDDRYESCYRVENASALSSSGEKGWLFADTVHGAIASANLYSIVESAKAFNTMSAEFSPVTFPRAASRSAADAPEGNPGHPVRS